MLRIVHARGIARRCVAMQIRMFSVGKGPGELPIELK